MSIGEWLINKTLNLFSNLPSPHIFSLLQPKANHQPVLHNTSYHPWNLLQRFQNLYKIFPEASKTGKGYNRKFTVYQ